MSGPADSFRPLGRGAPFSLGNKLERVLWRIVWLLLARATPPQFAAWRRTLLRLFGARVGPGAKVYGSVRIWLPRHLELGEGTIVGPGAELYNQGRIAIGPFCVVSQRAFLCASSHRVSDPDFALTTRPIALGRGHLLCQVYNCRNILKAPPWQRLSLHCSKIAISAQLRPPGAATLRCAAPGEAPLFRSGRACAMAPRR